MRGCSRDSDRTQRMADRILCVLALRSCRGPGDYNRFRFGNAAWRCVAADEQRRHHLPRTNQRQLGPASQACHRWAGAHLVLAFGIRPLPLVQTRDTDAGRWWTVVGQPKIGCGVPPIRTEQGWLQSQFSRRFHDWTSPPWLPIGRTSATCWPMARTANSANSSDAP